MALNRFSKFNRLPITKCTRSVVSNSAQPQPAEMDQETPTNEPKRYQVFKPRSTPKCINKFQFDNESHMANHHNKMQHMQPQLLPKFYDSRADFSALESIRTSASNKQQFEASKTYRCLTQPLKSSKLANPFPEPVKPMPSDTVSDQEKAQRMYSESRVPHPMRN